MQIDEVIEEVRRRAGLEQRDPAWDLTCRTLETLGACLEAEAALNLASQLPDDLEGGLESAARGTPTGEWFDPDEFVRRVADSVGYDAQPDDVREQVNAVLSTLSDAVTEGQWEQVLFALPAGYSSRL